MLKLRDLKHIDWVFVLLLTLASGYCAIFHYLRYEALQLGILHRDLGIYANYLWNTNFTDKILYSDHLYFWTGAKTFLIEHFAPTLLLLVPIYRLFPSPLTLLVIGSFLPLISAAFLYGISRQFLNSRWLALFIVLSYLTHTGTMLPVFDLGAGFYHDMLIAPLGLAALFFFFRNKFLFLGSLVLLLGVKSNVPLIVAIYGGILILLYPQYRKWGGIIIVISVVFLLMGTVGLSTLLDFPARHSNSIIQLVLESGIPLNNIAQFLEGNADLFLFLPMLLAPEFLVPLLSEVLIFAIAGQQRILQMHYAFPFMVVAMFAYVIGLRRMQDWLQPRLGAYASTPIFVVVGVCLGLSSYRGVQDFQRITTWEANLTKKYNILQLDLQEALSRVSEDDHLVTQSFLTVRLANRSHIAGSFHSSVDYILLHTQLLHLDYDAQLIEITEKLMDQGWFSVVYFQDEILLLKMVKSSQDEAHISELSRLENPPSKVDFTISRFLIAMRSANQVGRHQLAITSAEKLMQILRQGLSQVQAGQQWKFSPHFMQKLYKEVGIAQLSLGDRKNGCQTWELYCGVEGCDQKDTAIFERFCKQ